MTDILDSNISETDLPAPKPEYTVGYKKAAAGDALQKGPLRQP